eukprot:7531745-Pyramimonas_sp.AAC.1
MSNHTEKGITIRPSFSRDPVGSLRDAGCCSYVWPHRKVVTLRLSAPCKPLGSLRGATWGSQLGLTSSRAVDAGQ